MEDFEIIIEKKKNLYYENNNHNNIGKSQCIYIRWFLKLNLEERNAST